MLFKKIRCIVPAAVFTGIKEILLQARTGMFRPSQCSVNGLRHALSHTGSAITLLLKQYLLADIRRYCFGFIIMLMQQIGSYHIPMVFRMVLDQIRYPPLILSVALLMLVGLQ